MYLKEYLVAIFHKEQRNSLVVIRPAAENDSHSTVIYMEKVVRSLLWDNMGTTTTAPRSSTYQEILTGNYE
jgi:hypothetical protein